VYRVRVATLRSTERRTNPKAALADELVIATDLFEHREVKPHFINDCCFGEDFAAWLRLELADLAADGFRIEESIQEDYGWGFWVHRGKDRFWIALSYGDVGPTEKTPEWHVDVAYDPGLNLLKRLFHKPAEAAFSMLRDRVFGILRSTDGIHVIECNGR
jgi:hypothetical protein